MYWNVKYARGRGRPGLRFAQPLALNTWIFPRHKWFPPIGPLTLYWRCLPTAQPAGSLPASLLHSMELAPSSALTSSMASDVPLNPTLALHPVLPLRPTSVVPCPTDTAPCSQAIDDTTPAPSIEAKSSPSSGPPPRPPRNPLRPLPTSIVSSKPQAIDVRSANACGPKFYDPMSASVTYADASTPALSSAKNGASSEVSPPSAPYDHFQDATRIKSDFVCSLSHANSTSTHVEFDKLPPSKRESRVGSRQPSLAGSPIVVCTGTSTECAICEKVSPLSPSARHKRRVSRIRTSTLSRANGRAIGVDSPSTPFNAVSTWSQDCALHSALICDSDEHERDDCSRDLNNHDDPYDGDEELDDNEPPCQRDTYLW